MKAIFAIPILLDLALVSENAAAADKYLCCDLTAEQGACVAQGSACAESSAWWVTISDLTASEPTASALDPGYLNASFPSGIDGYASWTQSAPWVGFCLDAPAPQDPMHEGPTDPIGCISMSLKPLVSGEIADVGFPVDPRWDGFQLCYGAPNGGACQDPNNLNDPTVSLASSGSCCNPAQLLARENIPGANGWHVGLGQEIPSVPPPVILYGPDGGVVVFYNPDAGDTIGTLPDACVADYNEPSRCGQTPAAQGQPGEIGTASGSSPEGMDAGAPAGETPVSTAGPGGCSVSHTPSPRGEHGVAAIVGCLLGLALVRRRTPR